MDKLELNQILALNEKDKEDFQICYNYLKTYIENIRAEGFHSDYVMNLKALIDKFLEFIPEGFSWQKLTNDLNEYADKLEKSCVSNTYSDNTIDSEVTQNLIYQNLYSNFLKLYNKINYQIRNTQPDLLDFDGLINYDISNKKKAIKIIQEALELVETDSTLSEKSKKRIKKYLSDTIQELINPKTNWTNFFVKTTEIIIVLGALGSLTGGIEAGSNLLEAKHKIEIAKEEIVKTSINLNYMNVENTFNISKPIEIENNKILMLEQNNE